MTEIKIPCGLDQKSFEDRKQGPIKSFLLAPWFIFGLALRSVHFWWGICLCSAGIHAWATRHSMDPDGVSYLDLASGALSSGPADLVNGYWSPGYPALISIALFLFRPSASQEFPLIHFVNFLIFIFTLWAFSLFFRYWWAASHKDEAVNDDRKSDVTPFAFSTFLWFTLEYIRIENVTPDLAVAAIVFLAAGIGCRLCLPGSSWKHYVALGFVLGVGYYIKAAMFPLGLAFVALLFLLLPSSNNVTRKRLFFSLSVFLLVVTPLVAALSIRANTLTFGEAGRLNYLWFVNRLPIYWTGDSTDVYGSPEHPPRKLMERPLVIEFASPIKGTYPLWYDPSYWNAGAKVRFDLRQQIAALKETLRTYKHIALGTMSFISGAIVLFFFIIREKRYAVVPRISWWQLAWPLAAFSMYALVWVQPRYLGAFFVLFWLAIYRALIFRANSMVTVAVCATVLSTVMVPFTADLAMKTISIAGDVVHPRPTGYEKATLGLRNLGLQNGDRLAVVGSAYYSYFARYGRLRMVAQIPDKTEFWHLSTADLKSLAGRLASVGVKAVVALNRPEASAAADWKDVKLSDSARLSVLLLPPDGD